MTRRKQGQRVLWEGMIDEDVRSLWEPWMGQADRLLEDEELIDRVFEAQGKRHEYSATKGRSQTPAEMVLRLLLLKHVRNWSFDTLEREVKLNLAYRDFTRIGMGKVPDAKTLARIAQALGGEVIAELHRRLVEMAQEEGVIQGRKLRVDTTVVETNIHYPTDSSLLGDGARVLTRTMKKIETQAGRLKRKVRNRTRSVSKRVIGIATASRHQGRRGQAQEAVRGVVALHASDSQRHQTSDDRSGRDACEEEEGTARAVCTSDGDGGPCAASGEADQDASVRRHHATARQDRQLI